MNGAESLVHTLLKNGIKTCFANPGTSEMHFVAALDRIPGMKCVLGLQENIVTGMADGYYRMTGEPAATLLHCGPGLGNGLGNLHNAKRANSGIVNIVGDHATYHRPLDAPLAGDTEALARASSHWVRVTAKAEDGGADIAVAIQASRTAPGHISTLVLPADAAWDENGVVGPVLPVPQPIAPSPSAIENAAKTLRDSKNVLLLLGGMALQEPAQRLVHAIQIKTGCRAMAEVANARVQRGRGRLPIERIPYAAELAIETLKTVEHIILVNAKSPVGFFAYPGMPSVHYPARASIQILSSPTHDANEALQALADLLGAPDAEIADAGPQLEPGTGKPTPEGLARTLAAVIPENAIIADESVSFGRGFFAQTHAAPPHDWLQTTGGAIGCGMPLATGASIAAPGRRVINLQADGSAMYTLQALWTQARERLPITTVLLSNRKYQILLGEYRSVGATPGKTAMDMLDIGNPDINWVSIAEGMGVEAARTDSLEGCVDLLTASFKRNGPFLIELII